MNIFRDNSFLLDSPFNAVGLLDVIEEYCYQFSELCFVVMAGPGVSLMVVVLAPTVLVLQACFLLQPVFLSHHSSYLKRGQESNSFPLLFCDFSLLQHSTG